MTGPERLSATTTDGVSLALTRFAAQGQRRAVCLCTHAMMANSSYFRSRRASFAAFLAHAGIETYLLDWRGHGASVPPSPRHDSWGFEDYVQRDLPAAFSAVAAAAEVETGELCYLGHSLGGLVGLAAFGSGAVPLPRRLSLWATSVWLPGPRGPLKRRLIMRLYALASRPLGYAPVRRLRAGTDDEPRQYVEQLAGWALRGRWLGADGTDYLANLASITTPVLAVTGDGDRLSYPRDAEALRERLPNALPLRCAGKLRGDAIDPDHFSLFTDARLEPLWGELVSFLTR